MSFFTVFSTLQERVLSSTPDSLPPRFSSHATRVNLLRGFRRPALGVSRIKARPEAPLCADSNLSVEEKLR